LLLDFLAEEIQERKPVSIIQKDFRARVPAGGQVIERTGILQAKRAGHVGNLAGSEVQSQELTPTSRSAKSRTDPYVRYKKTRWGYHRV